MNIPGFSAEASLCKTGHAYSGYRGATRIDVDSVYAAQVDCIQNCADQEYNCELNCLPYFFTGSTDWFSCHAKCLLAGYFCEQGCPSGGGGHGPHCPPGTIPCARDGSYICARPPCPPQP
jgi:hypothetical protein